MHRQKKDGTPVSRKHATKAVAEIRYYQKHSDCVNFPLVTFDRFVKGVASNLSVAGESPQVRRFGKSAFDLLQHQCEAYLVDLVSAAQKIAIHSKREMVTGKDLQLVCNIRGV